MSEIMKKAWANFRKAMGTFSKCLKAAWAEAKGVINMKGSEKQVAWAEDIKTNMIRRFQADVDWMVKGRHLVRCCWRRQEDLGSFQVGLELPEPQSCQRK